MSAQNQRADQGPDLFSPTAHHPIPQSNPDSQHPFSSPPEGGMAAFPLGRTHLPTPQSPDFNMGQYVHLQPPESPLAHASYMSYSALARPPYGMPLQKSMTAMHGRSPQQQTITPETSPYAPRYDPSRPTMTSAIPFNPYPPNSTAPRASSSTTLASPATATKPPSRTITPPPSVPSPAANLSSPFMDKLTMVDKAPTPSSSRLAAAPSGQIPMHVDDIFSSSAPSSSSSANHPPTQTTVQEAPGAPSTSVYISTPPISQTPNTIAPPPLSGPGSVVPGGEMERIRQAMMQNQRAQIQEAEARRPEYLKRAKRPLSETDPPAPPDDDRRPGVGIMDSPHKGRRITLFQETSEESFEESLMAGGYGRYRTADWVRQPQPMAATPGLPGPSAVVKRVEKPPEAPRPPTEKELRKRKRLEAFRPNETTNTSDLPTSKLFPVNLEGKGRVLIDALSEEHGFVMSPAEESKSGNGGKRAMTTAAANKKAKKKPQEPSMREKKAMLLAAAALEDLTETPNWPDEEFPWRLRTLERAEITKEEGEQRMQLVEKFLNRDTDEEDASDEEKKDGEDDDEELLSPTAWDMVHEDGAQKPIPSRGGRGKMVQLSADPYATMRDRRLLGKTKTSRFFPTDPGDARAALLAKKSVRSLSYRQQRRQREQDDDDEVLCICRNKADNSQVVQCDNCSVWFHLHCIGIHSIKDLGPEEDPWFCEACMIPDRSESSDDGGEDNRASEPTFVPTDDEPPRASHSHDTPIFQPSALQDSPMPWPGPTTPPRGPATTRLAGFGSGFSSASASESPRQGEPFTPSTPQNSNRRSSVQIFGHDTPGLFEADDAPFDPTSTPSRGINLKFGGANAFTTPKNTLWPPRGNPLFQTPSKRRDSSSRLFGGPGTLDESAGGGGVFTSPFGRLAYDDSPIRRDTAPAGDGQRARRLLDSPIAPSVGGRYLGHALTLEDSPVMWSGKGKERAQEDP
ncbi:hypothetical protein DFH07DRAFT_863300 [Mycena maculata]|uniref:PHD-type domain-containing protein n=1 Tax=Mycena maculata TaxID=230809 RepID=A0AAD7H8R9_9AGAR|nr:hypothetical protein DFH07DRAFT_863300 [Mycena maculata]